MKSKKSLYSNAEIEVLRFTVEDIVTSSVTDVDKDGDPNNRDDNAFDW